MTDASAPELYDLLSWMSPSWPIGAFSYSSGLEWAVEEGLAANREAVIAWIADLLDHGAIGTEAVLFVHAHRTTMAGEGARLRDVAELAAAAPSSFERHLESTAQGAAFRRIARSTADNAGLGLLDPVEDEALAYPVVAACQMAAHGIAEQPALTAFLHGVAANLVSAAQRLVPLGQTDAQIAIHRLKAHVMACAERTHALPDTDDPFEQMGSATLMADFASMAHETQYTRLFRT